jgi:sugar phosphate permease
MKSKIYYGWWVVVSMMPAALIQSGAMFYSFGIFYDPFLKEFGWSRSEVSLALSIYLLTYALSSPVVGRLTDRFGPRRLIGTGAVVGGLAFMLLGRTTALWQIYALYFIQGLAFSGCGLIPVNTALVNWFRLKRGTAMGIAMTGISLGAIIITPLGSMILTNHGWRAAYLFLGFLTWGLVLPPVLFVMKDRPEQMGLFPDGRTPETGASHDFRNSSTPGPSAISDISMTPGQALRSIHFWMISLSYLIIHIAFCSILTHEIVFLTDKGISVAVAAAGLGLTGGAGGAGKLFFGYFSDKSSPRIIAPLCAALQAIGMVFLLFTHSNTMVWVSAVIFGFCMGGHAAVIPLVVGYVFGVGSFGAIYGGISMGASIGTAMAPLLAGFAYETLGNYTILFLGCIIASLGSAVLLHRTVASVKALPEKGISG